MGLAFDGGRGLLPQGTLATLAVVGDGEGEGASRVEADALAVAAAGLLLDQASKAWAWSAVPTRDAIVDLLPGALSIAPVANHGALANLAGSHSGTSMFCAMASLVLAAMAPGWAAQGRASAMGAGLVAAGLVGNAGDRLALGFVRDFLTSPHLPGWTFNLADLFLLLGAGMLAARAPRRSTAAPAESPRGF
jgi:lipoprotein signal peptidase